MEKKQKNISATSVLFLTISNVGKPINYSKTYYSTMQSARISWCHFFNDRDHLFSTCATFSEKLIYFTPVWVKCKYEHHMYA